MIERASATCKTLKGGITVQEYERLRMVQLEAHTERVQGELARLSGREQVRNFEYTRRNGVRVVIG